MTKPVEPVSPAQKVGDGKSFLERMERGMKNSDPETKKLFAEKLEKYVNEGKALNEARNEYKKVPGLSRAGGGGGGASGGGGDFSGMKGLDKPFKRGGKVKKFVEGGLEDTMSSLGKKGVGSGLEDAMSSLGKKGVGSGLEDAMSDSKKKSAMAGLEGAASDSLKKGAMAGLGMKSGGKVSSASKRADGCAIRGKTRA